MRTHGTLTKWNDDRGFGFIAPASGGNALFVHVSAFPRDGRRPIAGEVLSYRIETGNDGKARAVDILRPGRRPAVRAGRPRVDPKPAKVVQAVIAIVLIGLLAGYGYQRFKPDPAQAPAATATTMPRAEAPGDSPFRCDGRTLCPQMTSCAEARYFVAHCPNTKMDGNNDGEPCEQQWCNAD